MAKKKKTEDLSEPTISAEVEGNPAQCVEPLAEKYSALVKAAEDILEKYRRGHTVDKLEDYRYPGLHGLALALEVLKK